MRITRKHVEDKAARLSKRLGIPIMVDANMAKKLVLIQPEANGDFGYYLSPKCNRMTPREMDAYISGIWKGLELAGETDDKNHAPSENVHD